MKWFFMDDETLFDSLVALLRQHGFTSIADGAANCWNHGEENIGIGLCASALLEHNIKPSDNVLEAYGVFAKDTDSGLGFDDTDLQTYMGLKAL